MTEEKTIVVPIRRVVDYANAEGGGATDLDRFVRIGMRSLAMWSLIKAMIVISPREDLDVVATTLTTTFPMFSYTFVADEDLVVPDAHGCWVTQQILKLEIARRVSTPQYLTMDADIFLTRPLKRDDLFLTTLEPARVHADWWANSGRVLGVPSSFLPGPDEMVMGVTPQILKTGIVLSLLDELDRMYPSKTWHFLDFTEYTLYWTYVRSRGLLQQHQHRHQAEAAAADGLLLAEAADGLLLAEAAVWTVLPDGTEGLKDRVRAMFSSPSPFGLVQSRMYSVDEVAAVVCPYFEFPTPKIYWINLDRRADRRAAMEAQFEAMDFKNHTRIRAVDADADAAPIITPEIACMHSHFEAIRRAYIDGQEIAIIAEDDVDFRSTMPVRVPVAAAWDIVQMHYCCPALMRVVVALGVSAESVALKGYLMSCACYAISRRGMRRFLDVMATPAPDLHLNAHFLPNARAEEFVFRYVPDVYCLLVPAVGLRVEESKSDVPSSHHAAEREQMTIQDRVIRNPASTVTTVWPLDYDTHWFETDGDAETFLQQWIKKNDEGIISRK